MWYGVVVYVDKVCLSDDRNVLIGPICVMTAEIACLDDVGHDVYSSNATPVIQNVKTHISSLDLHHYVGGDNLMLAMIKNVFLYATKYGNGM